MTHAALSPLIGPEFDQFLRGSMSIPGKKPRALRECRGKRLPCG
jgi:hypothetical protein